VIKTLHISNKRNNLNVPLIFDSFNACS